MLEATLFLADALNLVGELPRGTEAEKHETAVLTFKQAMASGVESQLCKTLEAAGKSEGELTLYSSLLLGHASRAIGLTAFLCPQCCEGRTPSEITLSEQARAP